MIKLYIYAAIFFTAIATFTWVWQDRYDSGFNAATASMLKAVNKAVEVSREDEQIKQGEVNEAAKIQYDKINSINARLNNDLDRLRKRPSRKPITDNTKSNCTGVSGKSLSSEDAGFLTREAARADRHRTALETCYTYADTVVKVRKKE